MEDGREKAGPGPLEGLEEGSPEVVDLAGALQVSPQVAFHLMVAQETTLRIFATNYGIPLGRFEASVWADVLVQMVKGESPPPVREDIQRLFPGSFPDWREDDGEDCW